MSGAVARTRTVSAVIAEDEPILRADLQSRLAALWPELRLAGAAGNGVEALALHDAHRPDIMFLDIEMPGLDGLQVARQLSGKCHVVFITAYDSHAVAAFDHGAIDYVLKPYDNGRLSITLRRLRERLAVAPPPLEDLMRELALAARPKEHLRWIKASRGNQVDLIMVSDVHYFQADSKYTTVHTASQEAIIRRSIKELASELDPNTFWQIHRSTIINVEAIESVSRGLAGVGVKLRSRPGRLPVSDSYRHIFKHM
jgi:DNA-binding LytR/AlgR family response regulator